MIPRVLHLTEAYGGGLATAIDQYMQFSGAEHTLLARVRPDVHTDEILSDERRRFVTTRGELIREWMRIRRDQIDIVHVHSSIAAVLARSLLPTEAALVYSPHALAVAHERAWVRAGAAFVERSLAVRTHAFAAVSEPEREQLIGMSRSLRPVVMVPHSLATSAPPLPYEQREAQVVAVGRLSYQKNPESVTNLPQQFEDLLGESVRFTWIGDGDPERRSQLQSGGWEVTGWLPRGQVQKLVGQARALVHPARYEGMPFAVLEAMDSGTPVVACDIPVLRAFPSVARYTSSRQLCAHLLALWGDTAAWTWAARNSLEHVRSTFNATAQALALDRLYASAIH